MAVYSVNFDPVATRVRIVAMEVSQALAAEATIIAPPRRPGVGWSQKRPGIGLETQKQSKDEWALALVSVGQDQDRRAFAALFGHFAPRVKSYLMRSGAGESLAEETMQEALAIVWRKAGQFDPSRASAATWIFTIARNKQLDALRKLNRPEPEDLPWGLSDPGDPQTAAELAQEQERLGDAVAKLPSRQKEVIEKAFFGDLSHREIADMTGLPLGTIKSRIRLGLERLRYELTSSEK